jgi:hypothetical protein
MGLSNISHVGTLERIEIYIHGEAEFAFALNDNESADLGMDICIVFDFRKVCVIVGHRIEGVSSTRRLAEEN